MAARVSWLKGIGVAVQLLDQDLTGYAPADTAIVPPWVPGFAADERQRRVWRAAFRDRTMTDLCRIVAGDED
ncbi:MAG: hypothetical protein ABR598_05975 [Candidatus Dormibacteria bacterium]